MSEDIATLAKRNLFIMRLSRIESDVLAHGLTEDEIDMLLAGMLPPPSPGKAQD